ncbi:MAG TPA: polymer-forming cytoskeletal protein [Patescibacteria group bacterium]|nr:polymer-forming cytoskeletal protein [Patescibacteria group bacterium]
MENNTDTIIGINVTLKGNLHNKGSIQVNGNIEGEVRSDENILIGETAKIKGPVIAKKIEISGEIKGLVEATEKLEVNSSGRVYGDINAKSLVIKEGAIFVGKSTSAQTPGETTTEPEKTTSKESPEIIVEPVKENKDKLGFFGKK